MELIPDILRAVVTGPMIILLLFTMAQPKYGKNVMYLTVIGFLLINISTSVYFYVRDDYTSLAKFSALFLFFGWFSLKPLFKESIMQWCFNFITVINVFVAILVLSYALCQYLPYPNYAITLLRFLFFAMVIFSFHRYIRPLYRNVVKHWNVFFFMVAGLFINFIYYIFSSNDIQTTLTEQFVPMFLLIVLSVCIYISIFYSLKTISDEYILREENIKNQAREALLQSELNSYEDFISISRQNRHDLRHHNALLSEYLTRGDMEGARTYLQQFDESIAETALKQYCKNPIANAVFRLYERRAEENGIAFAVSSDIPETLTLTTPELGVLLSNILENAYEACGKIDAHKSFISFSSETDEESLKMELRNSNSGTVLFKDNLPISTKQGGGTGTKSVANIISKHGGMLRFKQKDEEFITQIILPLN